MIELFLTIALMGFLVWLLVQIPMPAPFSNAIIGIAVVLLVLWLLRAVVVHIGLPMLRFGR